jgi:ribosomal protein S16
MYKPTVIRMRKKGHLKDITYDLVVSYKDKRHRGDYLERVGFYSPHLKDNYLFISTIRLAY